MAMIPQKAANAQKAGNTRQLYYYARHQVGLDWSLVSPPIAVIIGFSPICSGSEPTMKMVKGRMETMMSMPKTR